MANSPTRRFCAKLFASPAIKSWNDGLAAKLRTALVSGIEAARGSGSLVFDVMVEFEAENLEPRLAASKVLLWRSRRSQDLGARVRRKLGFYSGESTLAAAVEVARAAELDALLPGTMLWDSEFTIYPPPKTPLRDLPDPHYEIPGFASEVSWSVNQDTGSESWLITAVGEEALNMVCGTLARAFEQEGLGVTLTDPPPAVYG